MGRELNITVEISASPTECDRCPFLRREERIYYCKLFNELLGIETKRMAVCLRAEARAAWIRSAPLPDGYVHLEEWG